MKTLFKACLLSLLLLVLLSPAFSHAENIPQPQPATFLARVQAGDFVVMYNPEASGSLRDIIDASSSAYADMSRLFAVFSNHTTIEVAKDNNEFRLLSGVGDAPDSCPALNWNEGYNGLIVIKSPTILPGFRTTLAHQMARVAERNLLTSYRSMPEWYQDGVASYAAGDFGDSDSRDAGVRMALTGGWRSLADLERDYRNMTIYNSSEPEYVQARVQAALLAGYIGRHWGNASLTGILADFGTAGDLNASFVNRTGYEPDALNEQLKDSLLGVSPDAPADQAGTGLAGYLLAPGGQPVPGQAFTISGPDGNVSATTDAAGHFQVNLTPGTYSVLAQGPGLAIDAPVTVGAGEQVRRNFTAAAPADASATPAPPSAPGADMLLPGLLVAFTAVGALALLALLRRSWP